jgi:hypothetical protein
VQRRKHLPVIDLLRSSCRPGADAGVFPSDAQAIYDGLGSSDKHLPTLTGDHYTPDTVRDELADAVAGWVGERS